MEGFISAVVTALISTGITVFLLLCVWGILFCIRLVPVTHGITGIFARTNVSFSPIIMLILCIAFCCINFLIYTMIKNDLALIMLNVGI